MCRGNWGAKSNQYITSVSVNKQTKTGILGSVKTISGAKFAIGMILANGSTGGLTDFEELIR